MIFTRAIPPVFKPLIKRNLLMGTALCVMGLSNPAMAQCVTTGAINASCNMTSSTTDAIELGNGGAGVTATITGSITIGNTIDDDDGTPDGILATDGSGITITQTAAIGDGNPIDTITISDNDTWNASNNISTTTAITIGGGTSGILNIDGSANTVTIGTTAGGIEVAAGGALTISDTTFATSVAATNGIDLAAGAILTIHDDTNLTIGAIDGNAAGQGTLVISAGHNTDATIGDAASLAAINLTGGVFIIDQNVTADATTMSAGTEINVTAGTFSSAVTGSTGIDTIDLDGGTINQAIDLGAGADVVEIAGGTLSSTLTLGTGNDTIQVTGAATLSGDIAGGDGTDSLDIDASQSFSGDISGIESADVADGQTLTFTGAVSDEMNIVLNGTGALSVNATGKSLALDIDGAADAGDQTVTLTDGAITGSIALSDGNDTLNLDGATFSGTIDGGTGATDTLDFGADFTTGGTITGFEQGDLGGNTLTVEHTITGFNAATQAGLDVNGGQVNINDGGSFGGGLYDTAGTGSVEFGADSAGGTFNLAGIIEDLDVIVTSGTVNTNGFTLGAASAIDDLNIAAGARFNANENITSSGDLINTGTFFIDAGNTASFNDHTAAAGTIIFEIENDGGTLRNARIVLTGGASDIDLTGATIEISIPTNSGVIADGAEFLIGNGMADITGADGTEVAVEDGSFLYDFTIVDGTGIDTPTNNTDLYAIANRKSITGEATTTNNQIMARVLLSDLADNADATIELLKGALINAETKDAYNAVLKSVTPLDDDSITEASFNLSNIVTDLTYARLDNDIDSGVSTGDVTAGVKMWLQAFGTQAEQEERNGIAGYESDIMGIAGGFDSDTIFDDTILGFGIAYARTDLDSENLNRAETKVNSVQLSTYGEFPVTDDIRLDARTAYTWSDNEITRYDIGGLSNLSTNADYQSYQVDAHARIRKDFFWGDYTTLTPSVIGRYAYYDAEEYQEAGSGAVSLIIDGQSKQKLDLGLGLDASWLYRTASNSMVKPVLRTEVVHDMIGDRFESINRFVGAQNSPFTVLGPTPDRTTYKLGTSLQYYSTENFEFSVDYDYTFKEDFTAHSAYIKAAYMF